MVRNLLSNSQRNSRPSSAPSDRSNSRPISRQAARRLGMGAMGGLMTLVTLGYPLQAKAEVNSVQFEMYPVAQFVPCLAKPGQQPKVRVTVVRGDLNDHLNIQLEGFKEGVRFDLFSIENTPQLPDGKPDPNFQKKFGLAWYQSDLEAGATSLKTIFLDQIFGLDDSVGLKPVNTFHMGFWFNDPKDAAACGFDVTKPTPFNGEHKAGPLAFVTRQVAGRPAKLGPLCTKPNSNGTCDP
jgi:hypothetical protein